ncbi:MAG: ParA family partition ATPase [Rickettsiales bacterium]
MKPYVITVAQQKGGSGKSTIAVHLAIALTKLGNKVALIDTDPQKTTSHWFNLRKEMTFECKYPVESYISTGWKVANEISRLNHVNIIIIDSPPHMETENKAAIRSADLVLIPCQPSPNDLWATNSTLETVAKENKNKVLILNRCPHQSKLLKQIEDYFPQDLTKYTIGNRVAFAGAMMKGLTSIETEPHSVATNEVMQIAENLFNAFIKK